jgi:hypothetical protein
LDKTSFFDKRINEYSHPNSNKTPIGKEETATNLRKRENIHKTAPPYVSNPTLFFWLKRANVSPFFGSSAGLAFFSINL